MADYLRRDIVLEIINTVDDKNGFARYEDYCVLFDEIDTMPAADVQPVNQWISCKDKMPDDGVNVLIYTGNRMISLAWYDIDMGYFYICDSDYKYNSLDVTHWQPLPEPPKED